MAEAKKRILYAEDNDSMRRSMTRLLERFNCEVVAVDSAKAGIEEAKKSTFDLVLTDREMEEPWAGFDLTKAVRQLDPDVPIIMMSGYRKIDEPLLQRQLEEAGGTTLVNKELEIGDLKTLIASHLAGEGRSR